MPDSLRALLREHLQLTRRRFTQLGIVASSAALASAAADQITDDPRLQKMLADLEPWLTPDADFQDVSRGNPQPHSIPSEQKVEVGLTRDTWRLNVVSDPDNPARIRRPLEGDTAFAFSDLMELAKVRAVRFPKVMTCLNIGCPLGNGIWEGVPLRDVIWKTQPLEDLRRVFYYGYHNEDPKQLFQSSLPIGRVLEDLHGLPPVILCYKLNGEWLSPERGGPVRIVVPEAYGFKSIKWLTHLMLSNIAVANDTYAEKNNDVDSPLKTFCATLTTPDQPKPDESPITGWAQAGISGLKKVQVWIHNQAKSLPTGDPHFTTAPWKDASLLDIPQDFASGLPNGRVPNGTLGFDAHGRPVTWPLPLTKAHWYFLHPGLPAGEYSLRCRTIDNNGIAQPMPRPFRKSGHAKIEHVQFTVG